MALEEHELDEEELAEQGDNQSQREKEKKGK